MNGISVLKLFVLLSAFKGGFSSDTVGTYLYKELGCTEKNDANIVHYECPNLKPTNGSCNFKGSMLNFGERIDRERLHPCLHCSCGWSGVINCAHTDCFFPTLKSGCRHKYSSDSCCPVGTVCGAEFQEKKEESDEELKAPFCQPRKCYDQAYYPNIVANYGAPAYFKDTYCCPNIWIEDEGQEIVKILHPPSESGLSCKFGNRQVKLGYGFKRKERPYGREIRFTCMCNMPPLVICREDV